MHILLTLAGTVCALFVTTALVPGFTISGLGTAVVVAILLTVANSTVRPILSLLTLPITILTFGLFSLVVHAGILLVLARLVEGFTIDGFIPALFGGVVLALVQWLVHRVV